MKENITQQKVLSNNENKQQHTNRFNNLSYVGTNNSDGKSIDIVLSADWTEEIEKVLIEKGVIDEDGDPSLLIVSIQKLKNGLEYHFSLSDGWEDFNEVEFTQEEQIEILSFIKQNQLHPEL